MEEIQWYLEYKRGVHNGMRLGEHRVIKIQFGLKAGTEGDVLAEAKTMWDGIVSQEKARILASKEEYDRYDGLCGFSLSKMIWGGCIPSPCVVCKKIIEFPL